VSQLPEYPWKVIGTELFELEEKHYLPVVNAIRVMDGVHEGHQGTSVVG